MNRSKNISFYLMLAGIAFIAFSVFLLWNSYKKKTTKPEPEAAEADQEPDQEPEPAGRTITPEPKPGEPAGDPGAGTPPFVEPE